MTAVVVPATAAAVPSVSEPYDAFKGVPYSFREYWRCVVEKPETKQHYDCVWSQCKDKSIPDHGFVEFASTWSKEEGGSGSQQELCSPSDPKNPGESCCKLYGPGCGVNSGSKLWCKLRPSESSKGANSQPKTQMLDGSEKGGSPEKSSEGSALGAKTAKVAAGGRISSPDQTSKPKTLRDNSPEGLASTREINDVAFGDQISSPDQTFKPETPEENSPDEFDFFGIISDAIFGSEDDSPDQSTESETTEEDKTDSQEKPNIVKVPLDDTPNISNRTKEKPDAKAITPPPAFNNVTDASSFTTPTVPTNKTGLFSNDTKPVSIASDSEKAALPSASPISETSPPPAFKNVTAASSFTTPPVPTNKTGLFSDDTGLFSDDTGLFSDDTKPVSIASDSETAALPSASPISETSPPPGSFTTPPVPTNKTGLFSDDTGLFSDDTGLFSDDTKPVSIASDSETAALPSASPISETSPPPAFKNVTAASSFTTPPVPTKKTGLFSDDTKPVSIASDSEKDALPSAGPISETIPAIASAINSTGSSEEEAQIETPTFTPSADPISETIPAIASAINSTGSSKEEAQIETHTFTKGAVTSASTSSSSVASVSGVTTLDEATSEQQVQHLLKLSQSFEFRIRGGLFVVSNMPEEAACVPWRLVQEISVGVEIKESFRFEICEAQDQGRVVTKIQNRYIQGYTDVQASTVSASVQASVEASINLVVFNNGPQYCVVRNGQAPEIKPVEEFKIEELGVPDVSCKTVDSCQPQTKCQGSGCNVNLVVRAEAKAEVEVEVTEVPVAKAQAFESCETQAECNCVLICQAEDCEVQKPVPGPANPSVPVEKVKHIVTVGLKRVAAAVKAEAKVEVHSHDKAAAKTEPPTPCINCEPNAPSEPVEPAQPAQPVKPAPCVNCEPGTPYVVPGAAFSHHRQARCCFSHS
ncbi:hypothetical protein GQ602_002785 [Ophiocordyceps camponoti-floridani]|uniref:Uncharacterized protein n=1 Tax=Ophiocordyceps camponoti-floridani TaxID=2030778 RepID=A0A8H4QB32_9HYPO|nr:hypothetical protein GQ602_002785 [Ophiocordyceps camponoti-floridani]